MSWRLLVLLVVLSGCKDEAADCAKVCSPHGVERYTSFWCECKQCDLGQDGGR